jgi:lipopolysaccharide export system protein LptA
MRRASLPLLAALLATPAPGPAQQATSQLPIELTADFADIDESRGRSLYKGKVEVRQGEMQLLADEVTIYHEDRQPTRLVAEGSPVKFSQRTADGTVRGEARRAEYGMADEQLVLIGDALVVQNEDTMRSDRITYDRATSVVRAGAAAAGSERVRITIQPQAE